MYYEVSSNSDDSCFCCCQQGGVTVYDSYPLQKRLNLVFEDNDGDEESGGGGGGGKEPHRAIGKCFLLDRSNYVALVGGGDTNSKPAFPLNQVVLWDDLLKQLIFRLKFLYPVERIILTRLYLIVLISNEIQVFTFTNPPKRIFPNHTIKTGPHIDFKLVKSQGILAYESLTRVGQIYISRITDVRGGETEQPSYLPTNIIKAHKNPIQYITLSPNGKYIATCSQRGTLIRVFNTMNGRMINEFRRGMDMATIYAMKFNQSSTQLCVISNKQTLHIFQLDENQLTNKSLCLIKLFNPLIRDHHVTTSTSSNIVHTLFKRDDRCEILWNDNMDKSIILIWKKYRIWIRYLIIYDKDSSQHEIVKESWRQLL